MGMTHIYYLIMMLYTCEILTYKFEIVVKDSTILLVLVNMALI